MYYKTSSQKRKKKVGIKSKQTGFQKVLSNFDRANNILLLLLTCVDLFCQSVSRSVVSDSATPWTIARQTPCLCPWNSLGKNTGVGSHFLLQGVFPTQQSNLGLLHYRQILYHLGATREALFYSRKKNLNIMQRCRWVCVRGNHQFCLSTLPLSRSFQNSQTWLSVCFRNKSCLFWSQISKGLKLILPTRQVQQMLCEDSVRSYG